ncbi:MAG TPA: uL15 family ribosomal protein [Methanomassiliicoccaceae archaeon]|jgi:large subunit ribosomal protein L15|nr:50S ribosomal protein L15 [Euryarchaeota archaeon]HOB38348.1 uL15 family ribosomal protein [Methanomassiliicoccaceae archaeon]HOK27568.1 uL15 family ribosomal protein [Methanomassiliicoccaceae archaeon]HOQ26166.1 uL15 family ribosomal protein [Methanomassiliicoccaceae archaeon]HPP45643.1 uL15 family ribosomal protein [Methanomassiliicoccaceae archaeon]
MPSRTNKFRGRRTHGRGKKAGRGAGIRGGHGNAGLHKHKTISVLKYDPKHFGRYGFKRPQKMVSAKITLNVGDLEQRLEEFLKQGFAVKEDDKVKVNLTNMGVDKLLGFGKISNSYEVVVAEYSAKALEKLEAAGGSIQQP